LIGLRRMVGCLPALLETAGGAETKAALRTLSIKTVGDLGGPTEVAPLLGLLMRLSEPEDLKATERALIDVQSKADAPEANNKKIIGLMPQADAAQKCVLLSVLGSTKGADALEALRAEAKSPDTVVRGSVLDAFVGWKTAEVAPDLLAVAQAGASPLEKIKALRAYISLIQIKDLAAEKKLEIATTAGALTQRDEEKKLLIGALGSIASPQALALVLPHLDSAETREEAAMAALAIGQKIAKENPKEVAEALAKVMETTKDKETTARAKAILKKMQ
jgi:hypothetical protein